VDGIKYAKFIFSGSSIPIELNIVKPEKTLDVTIVNDRNFEINNLDNSMPVQKFNSTTG